MRGIIRITLLLSCCFIMQIDMDAQSGRWTWMKGSPALWPAGHYGTKGVPDPANEPPGRYEPSYWIDLEGNFWLFGGNNGSGLVNDLWKFDPRDTLWTWMNGPQGNTNPAGNFGVQGVPSPLNYPQALGYGALNWVDKNGDLWLFGGLNFTSPMDGLWKYQIATNEWTWMKGSIGNTTMVPGVQGQFDPANTPGAINECKSAWILDDQLWFFGGQNSIGQQLGSLWCYDIATNNWSWKSGLTVPYYIGNYGTLGVSSPNNFPSARVSYTNWKDTAGNFYLFAGDPTFGASNIGTNDVWRYSSILNEWTWIEGSSTINHVGYGQNYCDYDSLNIPRSRVENMSVQSSSKCSNAFWTFGGFNTGGHDFHNDLWLFNPDSNAWKLVKGQTSTGGFGTYLPFQYGTQGVSDTSNLPPGRGGGAIWNDTYGNVWVFGGMTNTASGWGFTNDLWKFEPDTSCFHVMVEAFHFHLPKDTVLLCEGDTFHINVPHNIQIQVQPAIGAMYDTMEHVIVFDVMNTTTYTIVASSILQNSPCSYVDTFVFQLNVIEKPIADFILNPIATNLSQPTFTVTNTSTYATTVTWYDSLWNVLSTDSVMVKSYNKSGTYCFTLVAANSCNQFDTITKCGTIKEGFDTGVQNVQLEKDGLFLPNAFTPNGDGINDYYKPIVHPKSLILNLAIYNRWGNRVYRYTEHKLGWNGIYQGKNCEAGTYVYTIEYEDEKREKKIVSGEFSLIR